MTRQRAAHAHVWRPIETAPNGAAVLVARSTGDVELVTAQDNDYEWIPYVADGLNRATHWMPVPKPPRIRKYTRSQ